MAEKEKTGDIRGGELALAAGLCAGATLCIWRFSATGASLGSIGSWSTAAWAAGAAAAAFAFAFMAVMYRCYLQRRYGKRAPLALAWFVAMHLLLALFIVSRGGR